MEEEKKDNDWQDLPKPKLAWRNVPRRLLTKEEADEYTAILRELYGVK